jgi:hypothetical protein
MDNLEGRFKSYDAVRRQESANEYRLSEVKNKLLYNAERALRPHLSKLAGVRVLSTRVDNLEVTEDIDSGAPVFTGKVIADVSFFDGKNEKRASIPVSILHSQPEVISKDLREALEKATAVEEAPLTSNSTSITASLSDFKIVDDGTRYLKIYHTAAYGDLEPIGAISKEEYVTASNKSDLLSEMLKDEAVSWPADVTFTGEFAEPTIVEASVPADTQYVVKADPTLNTPEVGTDLTWKNKVADGDRLAAEAAQKNMDDLKVRLMQRALSAFNDAWKARGTGSCNVKNTTSTWDPASGVGEIKIEAEVLDGKDVKLVPFVVNVNGSNMRLPDFSNLAALLKEAKIVTNEIQGENIHKNVVIEKTAAPMAPSKQNYQDVLRLPKDFLPASLKEGDVIAVDGLRYRLTSKSEGQLSNQRDTASHWLFERVHGDEKPIYRQESY